MYLSMLCLGLYYTYKQVGQRRSLLPLRKSNRMLQIKDHMKRKKFIERNRMWFLKNLASGDKGRDQMLKVLDEIPGLSNNNTFNATAKPQYRFAVPREPCSSMRFEDFHDNPKLQLQESMSESTLSVTESPLNLSVLRSQSSVHFVEERDKVKEVDKATNTYFSHLQTYERCDNANDAPNYWHKNDVDETCSCTLDTRSESIETDQMETSKRTKRRAEETQLPAVEPAPKRKHRKRKMRKCYDAPKKVQHGRLERVSETNVTSTVKRKRGRKRKEEQPPSIPIDSSYFIKRTRSGRVYNRNQMGGQLMNAAKLS